MGSRTPPPKTSRSGTRSADPPTTRRAAGRARRLENILAAAARLFAEPGFAKTTVDEVAVVAGVSKGLVYEHFRSKEELLDAVWDRLVETWVETTLRGTKLDTGSVADAIAEQLIASIHYARENPLLRRILAQDPGGLSAHGRENADAFARLYRGRMEALLARGVRSGELRRGLDVRATAELIWILHFALVRELFLGHGRWRADADELLASMAALLVSGLRGGPGPAKRRPR